MNESSFPGAGRVVDRNGSGNELGHYCFLAAANALLGVLVEGGSP
jgi:hypothetical protein